MTQNMFLIFQDLVHIVQCGIKFQETLIYHHKSIIHQISIKKAHIHVNSLNYKKLENMLYQVTKIHLFYHHLFQQKLFHLTQS